MQENLSKNQKKLPHLFLPIMSVEKFLYSVIKENSNPALRRIINDKYFIVSSLNDIVAEYNKGTLEGATDNNKNFYKVLCNQLVSIGTSEEVFVSGLCDDIVENIDFTKFVRNLKQKLNEL